MDSEKKTTDGCDALNLLGKISCCQMAGSEVIYGSVTQNQTLQSLCHALKDTGTQPGNIFYKLLILFSHWAAVCNWVCLGKKLALLTTKYIISFTEDYFCNVLQDSVLFEREINLEKSC